MRRYRLIALLASAVISGYSVPAMALSAPVVISASAAQDAASGTSETEILRAGLKAALERVEALERRLQAVEQSAGIDPAMTIPDSEQAQLRGRGLAQQSGSAGSAAASQTVAAEPVVPRQAGPQAPAGSTRVAEAEPDRKAPAPSEAQEAIARAEQGHFGRSVTFESGFNYSYFNSATINLSGFLALDSIFLGTINIDEINSNVFTADYTLRLGVTRRLQFDANVPYLFRHTNYKSGGAGANAQGLVEADARSHGLGDVSFGASWRMLRETFKRPDVVINVRGKAPTGEHPFGIGLVDVQGSEGNLTIPQRLSTGTGVWSISGGVSMLKTIDPMVVFASVNYFHNFEGQFEDVSELPDLTTPLGRIPGRVKIGDAIQFGAGVAFALNERSSLSFSFTERLVKRSKIATFDNDFQTIVGSQANIAQLNIGATFALSDRLALMTNISTGLTRDAPGLTLGFRLPYRF